MKKDTLVKLTKNFEESAHAEAGVEYWMARDIQALLEYEEWRNFCNVIEKAKMACQNSGRSCDDHFVEVNKKVMIGSEGLREITDVVLSRYACYLIAQNGDSRKEPIAFAQTYFAIQTGKQEILEKRIGELERLEARKKLTQTEKELSTTLYEHGIDDQGFARVRSKGDQALFGGRTTIEMKKKLGIPPARPLADFLPTITIKAKDFAGEITHFNVRKEDLQGEHQITKEHEKNNRDVRQVLAKSNIYPEELPPEEDVKKLERRIKNQDEKALQNSKELPYNIILPPI
ncbi:MAG: DNA damage-inducible protein D [Chlamydiae bacterium CG10_big_fil_rev_8_21_14_0_10_42_34]|nr:MAG: DNA damage-inducible protein D [Chlamydiae bacterium CG10_big_fil_rev_8_21_14_0_10_42_34]